MMVYGESLRRMYELLQNFESWPLNQNSKMPNFKCSTNYTYVFLAMDSWNLLESVECLVVVSFTFAKEFFSFEEGEKEWKNNN